MDPDYLRKYYHYERNHWWFLVREKIIVQQLHSSLPPKTPLKILNGGCATGRSSQMLMPFGDVTSVEKDHATCVFLREQLNIEVIEADITSLPFEDDSFDIICIFDVIEHLDAEKEAIAELNRVCKPGGVLYCSVPAYLFLWGTHDEINQHKRRYTANSIRETLNPSFEVEYCTYFNTLLFLPIWFSRRVLQRISRVSKKTSDFEYSEALSGRLLSFIFKSVFSLEVLLLRYIKFPFGVSILLRSRKLNLLLDDDKHL